MTRPSASPKLALLLACATAASGLAHGGASAADAPPAAAADETPADIWPMFRGVLSGTGRSAARFMLPLAERWQRRIEKTAFDATAVIADGRIFIGDLDGTFHCLALDDGRTLWSFTTDVGFPAAAAVSRDPAVVVVGDATGMVRAFDTADGTLLWTHGSGAEISGGPTLLPSEGGTRVLVGSQDAVLVCLGLADGAVIWKHTINDQIRCSPTVTAGKVLLAGCDGRLHVIDAETGDAVVEVPIDGPTGTTPAAAGDLALFGSEGGVFWAIDVGAGTPAWKLAPQGNGQAFRSSAAIAGDLAIVGTRGRAVEAFATADGARRWREATRGRVDASPVVVHLAADGATGAEALGVVVADSAGKIALLGAADGERLWEFDAGGSFTASAAVAQGSIVIASGDGTVWCFGGAGG
ncbi:MAG: PQQ-binding-like beta-propeller repeat protein [Planctomycetota bacterium]